MNSHVKAMEARRSLRGKRVGRKKKKANLISTLVGLFYLIMKAGQIENRVCTCMYSLACVADGTGGYLA